MARATTATADAKTMAQRFKALAEEKRLQLLVRLGGDECCVCDLVDQLEAGQSLLSFHLKTLREAGLVEGQRRGRWVYYSLRQDALTEVREFLERLESAARRKSSCC
jgi:ArsR family transcriptional regulator